MMSSETCNACGDAIGPGPWSCNNCGEAYPNAKMEGEDE